MWYNRTRGKLIKVVAGLKPLAFVSPLLFWFHDTVLRVYYHQKVKRSLVGVSRTLLCGEMRGNTRMLLLVLIASCVVGLGNRTYVLQCLINVSLWYGGKGIVYYIHRITVEHLVNMIMN